MVIKSDKEARLGDILDIIKGKRIKCGIMQILLVNLSELSAKYRVV